LPGLERLVVRNLDALVLEEPKRRILPCVLDPVPLDLEQLEDDLLELSEGAGSLQPKLRAFLGRGGVSVLNARSGSISAGLPLLSAEGGAAQSNS